MSATSAVAVAAAMAVTVSASDVAASTSKDKRPNFVFMLADDWGWGDVGVYGANGNFALSGTNTRTPNLDALARNGTLFTDFHTAQAFCAPSRTGFMTGKYPADLSVNTNWATNSDGAPKNLAAGNPYQLPTPAGTGPSPWKGGLPNVPHLLQQAGYATAHFGKWHLGGCSPSNSTTPKPSDYGFDRTGTYGSPVEAGCVPRTDKDEFASLSQIWPADQWWSADVDDYTRNQGIEVMTQAVQTGKPFYLQLWWHMSHDTIDPRPSQYNETFPYKTTCLFPAKAACNAESGGTCEPCNWQIFWGSQTWSDMHRIGPVIDAVDELGIRDNTYIIFSTDNGAQAERWTNNAGGSGPNRDTGGAFSNAVGTQGPFRGCKASLYEGGHRVPFIISGPGVPKRRVDHSLISAVDWLPTVMSISGTAIPEGTLLRGEDISDIWHGERNHATIREKPLLWRGGGGPAPCWNRSPPLAARNGDWKLLTDLSGTRVELYNMSLGQLGRGGAFFEASTESNPEEVQKLLGPLLEWHRGTVCPFGGQPGTCDAHGKYIPGCDAYPFPGVTLL
mmetsp:Transcript_24273/g.72478  ORF Transcript_24273/g.72478 Transcript_24273/m.72478 type:complete len:560 (-) Transcript_24273:1121-2800(-)